MSISSSNSTKNTYANENARRLIGYWLLAIAFMVFIMVVLGGITRLTQSGLSMVEWRPVTGWLPPMTDASWNDAFGKYRDFPEYREKNLGMTLVQFKEIFWLEFLHRLWGRVIGLAFFVPLVFFMIRGHIRGRLAAQVVGLFVLGASQGGLGWFMVKSGLVDRPDVSQYRLAAHLILALTIYAYLIWVALSLLRKPQGNTVPNGVRNACLALIGLIFLTAFSGALVAGLDAGLTYNTFPLMDGALIPDGLFSLSPWYLNFFESILTVQFDHRVLAMTTLVSVLALGGVAKAGHLSVSQRRPVTGLQIVVVVQVALGITTLLMVVPVALGALHQAGAVLLLGMSVWAAHALRN